MGGVEVGGGATASIGWEVGGGTGRALTFSSGGRGGHRTPAPGGSAAPLGPAPLRSAPCAPPRREAPGPPEPVVGRGCERMEVGGGPRPEPGPGPRPPGGCGCSGAAPSAHGAGDTAELPLLPPAHPPLPRPAPAPGRPRPGPCPPRPPPGRTASPHPRRAPVWGMRGRAPLCLSFLLHHSTPIPHSSERLSLALSLSPRLSPPPPQPRVSIPTTLPTAPASVSPCTKCLSPFLALWLHPPHRGLRATLQPRGAACPQWGGGHHQSGTPEVCTRSLRVGTRLEEGGSVSRIQ